MCACVPQVNAVLSQPVFIGTEALRPGADT